MEKGKSKGNIMKNLMSKIFQFFKKYGIDAVIALLIFNFPMYAVFFIENENFRIFATAYIAFFWGLGPLTPGWLLTILLAVFIRWLRLGMWKGILWMKEAVVKIQLQNQFAAYLTSEEINMILRVAKEIHKKSEDKMKIYKEEIRKIRLQALDDKWTEEVKRESKEVI